MDEATWAALTIVLTVLGAVWTVVAFRRRGAASGLRALGFTLLPTAAWLTGTLRMFTEIGSSVTRWATSLVFNPMVWTGVGLAGTAAVFIVLSGFLRDRQLAQARGRGALGSTDTDRTPSLSKPSDRQRSTTDAGGGSADPDLDEIEEMLRKRGIQ